MSCTAGMLWGSKCAFKCKDERLFLSHREPFVCNDDLQWQGNEPDCVDYDTYGKLVGDFVDIFKQNLIIPSSASLLIFATHRRNTVK